MSVNAFRAKVQAYRRALGVTQKQLAHELALNATVLSHKLNESDGMRLTHAEIKGIVGLLARWGAISRRSEALELLALMNVKPFTEAEWNAPPLNGLMSDAASTPVARLPVPLTALIGRDALLATLGERLADPAARLITLTGSGGVGKTRLALELARLNAERFAEGVVFVPLAGIEDAALVASEIAREFQIKRSDAALIDTLKAALAPRELLLVLDNFEHVLAAAPLVAELLAAASRLKILVTSRVVLNLYGENQYRVPPLDLPDLRGTLADLIGQPAVALFVARSQAVRRDFTLTEANARVVAEICARLDGLPLALELAAARCRLFSPTALLQRLDQPLTLLSGGAANVAPHQRTLRDTIAWSYALLDPVEQDLFRVMSAFPGGCTLDALEAVFAPGESLVRSIVDCVASLFDKSLIEQRETHFTMLETLREYGIELLLDGGEWDALRERQARYYARWVEATEARLSGDAQGEALAQLEAEHDNLRAILTWAAHSRPAYAVALIGSLGQFWSRRGYPLEGLRWASLVLTDDPVNDVLLMTSYAKALNSSGALAFVTGDYALANTYLRRALALRLQLEDAEGVASTYNNLGNLAWNQSDLSAARRYFEDAARIAEEINNRKLLASILNNLGALLQSFHDLPLAERCLTRALAIWREIGNKQSIANTLSNLGGAAAAQQKFDLAMTYFTESLTLQLESGNDRNAGAVLANMGEIALGRGDFVEAARYFEQTLALQRKVDYRWGIASALGDLGRIAFFQGDYGAALARLGEALATMRQLNDYAKIALDAEYLALTALRLKDTVTADQAAREALRLHHELGDHQGVASSASCAAAVKAAQGDALGAARLWGAAFRWWTADDLSLLPADQLRFAPDIASARASDPEAFDAAWRAGEALTRDDVLPALLLP